MPVFAKFRLERATARVGDDEAAFEGEIDAANVATGVGACLGMLGGRAPLADDEMCQMRAALSQAQPCPLRRNCQLCLWSWQRQQ